MSQILQHGMFSLISKFGMRPKASRRPNGKISSMEARKFYRDSLEEDIVGEIKVRTTLEGHAVEVYTLASGEKRYFATISGTHYCAHGMSIADAIGSALWKDPERRPSTESLIASINGDGRARKIALHEFRLITGACLTGCRTALTRAGKDESPMTADDIRNMVSREWGDKLISMLGWNEVRT
jgi:hypothetical protein